jgi:putative membrane protein
MNFKQVLKSWLLISLGVLIASNTAQGIHYDTTQALFFAVVLLSICNVFFKPLLMLFSLPFIILTFGLGVWLINALLFLLVSELVGGFHVDTFGNALWGALVVSITSAVANLLFGSKGRRGVNIQVNRRGPSVGGGNTPLQPRKPIKDDDDVIDI